MPLIIYLLKGGNIEESEVKIYLTNCVLYLGAILGEV